MNSVENKKRNIIFVPGIATTQWMTKKWKRELLNYFPNDDVFLLDEFYFYNQPAKLHEIINDILDILKNNHQTYIVAHSFGGILALVAYLKNREFGRDNIKKIITMASPHSMEAFALGTVKKDLEYNHLDLADLDIVTYGGYFDTVVPNRQSRILTKPYKSLFCTHNSFLFNKRIIHRIIRDLMN